ncbi:MAG: ABC transporter permease [Clostridia bacterium]|nr:ABC transporter permease [Clostridia bacterium]
MLKLISILTDAIAMGTVYLFGSVGETIQEKAGNLNLGTPGIMCCGALGGGFGVWLCSAHATDAAASPGWLFVVVSILFSMIFASAAGLIYAFLTVTLKANQNVVGLALTTFGVGVMKFFSKMIYSDTVFCNASAYFKNLFGNVGSGWFSKIFLSHGILVYLAIIIAIFTSVFIKKTRIGLNLRAVGENPATADAVGINISAYKYAFILIGSAVSGLGGLYYVMDKTNGTTFTEAPVEAFGWMAVALVIATMWKPVLSIFGSILFGGLYVISAYLPLSFSQIKLFGMVPYVITIVVLIVIRLLNKKDNQPPASLGMSYFREER